MRRCLLVVVLTLAGCSSDKTDDVASKGLTVDTTTNTQVAPTATSSTVPAQRATATKANVPWHDYTSGLQARIDSLETTHSCGELQNEQGNANANSKETERRTGHSNAELIQYIEDAIWRAACY